MRHVLLPVLMLCLEVLGAEEETITIGYDSLPPQPRVDPLVPIPVDEAERDPKAELLDRIDRRIDHLDRSIESFLHENAGQLPDVSLEELKELSEERRSRDEAWIELITVIKQEPSGIVPQKPDILDIPAGPSYVEDETARLLLAQNLLAIVECHRGLMSTESDTRTRTVEALEALNRIDVQDLPPEDHPRFYNLRLFFTVEMAVNETDPTKKEEYMIRAQRYYSQFRSEHDKSVQLQSAAWIMEHSVLKDIIERERRENGL